MKRLILFTIFAIGTSMLLLACGDTGVTVNTNQLANTAGRAMNTTVNTVERAANTVGNAINTATADSPADFMKEAAQGGEAEVELGRIAVKNAKSPEVKKFGQMMVDDHSKANAELKKIAETKKVTLPADIGPHQKTVDKLKGMTGADFDKEYVNDMVEDHESDVAAFQKQADNSSDPEVKAFAAKTLPVLKKHLDAIKEIQAKMK